MGDIAFIAALALLAGSNLYFAPHIGQKRVPMQWGFEGKPTWHAPRLAGLWGPLVFALAVRLLIFAAAAYTPDKVHNADIGLVLFSVVTAGVHLFMLSRWAAAKHEAGG